MSILVETLKNTSLEGISEDDDPKETRTKLDDLREKEPDKYDRLKSAATNFLSNAAANAPDWIKYLSQFF